MEPKSIEFSTFKNQNRNKDQNYCFSNNRIITETVKVIKVPIPEFWNHVTTTGCDQIIQLTCNFIELEKLFFPLNLTYTFLNYLNSTTFNELGKNQLTRNSLRLLFYGYNFVRAVYKRYDGTVFETGTGTEIFYFQTPEPDWRFSFWRTVTETAKITRVPSPRSVLESEWKKNRRGRFSRPSEVFPSRRKIEFAPPTGASLWGGVAMGVITSTPIRCMMFRVSQ